MFSKYIHFAILILGWTCPVWAVQKNWDDYSEEEREEVLITSAMEKSHRSGYRKDCSGFIEAILQDTGHDLFDFVRSYDLRANGVRLIYEYVQRSGEIRETKIPKPGDLVFFSNTYDLNHDRKLNDKLTHIGIVTSVDKDGTVAFLHILQKKVQTDYMNLFKPTTYQEDGKTLNSYLRRPQKNSRTSLLTSQLFDFFGSLNP